MRGYPLILADGDRAEQFLLVGRSRRLFHRFTTHRDRNGIVWATANLRGHVFAVTWLGSGWAFDEAGKERKADDLAGRQEAMHTAGDERHRQELQVIVGTLRFGVIAERVLWVIHQQVLRLRSSLLRLPDLLIAEAIWTSRRPAHWREEILAVLKSLTWLHVADGPLTEATDLGADTAVLTHVADLRGTAQDICGEGCEGYDEPGHHHFLINVGRGFLGILEQFAQAEDESGVRSYAFPVGSRSHRQSSTLRKVGRSGQLVSIYLPAKLGDRKVCEELTIGQHRLLQVIVRETTRNPRDDRESVSEAEVMRGNEVPTTNGKASFRCGLLDPGSSYVGFNGNKLRKGLGYLLLSPGGWLTKAGYSTGELPSFLRDLTVLTDKLALIPVGIQTGRNACLALKQIETLPGSPAGVSVLRRLHLRIYAPSDYLARWNMVFGWEDETVAAANDDALVVSMAVQEGKVSQKELAEGIGVDRSLLSKVLRGQRPWPEGWLDRATVWLTSRRGEDQQLPLVVEQTDGSTSLE